MRKSAIVIGFGAFFLTLGLLLRFFAYPSLAVIPLEQNTTQIVLGPNSKYFDVPTLKSKVGTIKTVATVIADKKASQDISKKTGKDIIVLDIGQISDDDNRPPPMDGFQSRVALDRNTGMSVPCSCAVYNGKPTNFEGLQIKFPFQTQQKAYKFWDNATGKAQDINFDGTDEINGVKVYKFSQKVPKAKTESREVPANLFGLPDKPIMADRFYTNDRSIWVEPETGVMIKLQEHQYQTLELPNEPNAQPVIATDTVSSFDAATVKKNTDEYGEKAMQLKFIRIYGPVGLSILGVLLLVGGIAMSMLGIGDRRREEEYDDWDFGEGHTAPETYAGR